MDAYSKEYRYDTYSDKFEKNGRLHNFASTVVYELRADDLLYSETSVKVGDTIKIEPSILWGRFIIWIKNESSVYPAGIL